MPQLSNFNIADKVKRHHERVERPKDKWFLAPAVPGGQVRVLANGSLKVHLDAALGAVVEVERRLNAAQLKPESETQKIAAE